MGQLLWCCIAIMGLGDNDYCANAANQFAFRDWLMEFGKKGNTHEVAINKLADYWQKKKK